MLALGEKTRRTRAELEETLAVMLEIEEGLDFAQSEAERRHYLFMRTLHRSKD
jgi:hypothetical protein